MSLILFVNIYSNEGGFFMKNLMSTNVFEFEEEIVICGSCLPNVQAEAYKKVQEKCKDIYIVCLEEIHMNMVAHKIACALREGEIKSIIFVTVDKSPHCVQMHYIRKELEGLMDLSNIHIQDFVARDNKLEEISLKTISLSKNLSKLESMQKEC